MRTRLKFKEVPSLAPRMESWCFHSDGLLKNRKRNPKTTNTKPPSGKDRDAGEGVDPRVPGDLGGGGGEGARFPPGFAVALSLPLSLSLSVSLSMFLSLCFLSLCSLSLSLSLSRPRNSPAAFFFANEEVWGENTVRERKRETGGQGGSERGRHRDRGRQRETHRG